MLDSQWRKPGFNPVCCYFEVWAYLFSPQCHSSLSYINEYLAIDGVENVSEFVFAQQTTVWLNASQRSRVGVRMNRSVRGCEVKCFEQSNGLDNALYKKHIFSFYHVLQLVASVSMRPAVKPCQEISLTRWTSSNSRVSSVTCLSSTASVRDTNTRLYK